VFCYFTQYLFSLFVEYEKLALRLRRGSTQWESTLFPAADVAVENKRNSLQDLIRPRKTSARYSPTFTKGDNIIATPEPSGKGNEPIDTSIAFEDGVNIMASFPSADHQLVSTTLNSGVSAFLCTVFTMSHWISFHRLCWLAWHRMIANYSSLSLQQ
jgi:hypothetical protein